MSIKGLAWDDHREDLSRLQRELRAWEIELDIEENPDDFGRRLLLEPWDFVVTDLVDDRTSSSRIQDAAGIKNAEEASKRVGMVFIITGQLGNVDLRHLNLPRNVVFKSKETPAVWLAGEMHDTLQESGLIVDHTKVFLIYGRDRGADGTSGRVESHLNRLGLQVIKGDPASFITTIPQDLLELMSPCAAFIAVCTPDDEWTDQTRVPRGNVLFEMGVALGLKRGLERLIILQKWGPNREDQAQLPSDFGSQVTIRFETSCDNAFPVLDRRLERLGLQIAKP